MIRGLTAAAVAVAAAATLLTYCSKNNQTVAMVGTTAIRLESLIADLERKSPNTLLSDIPWDEARDRLNELIKDELVYQAALEEKFDRREKIQSVLKENHDRFLLDILFNKAVLETIIKDSDIREFYNYTGKFVICKNIFFQFPVLADAAQRDSVKTRADSVYALITAGADFEDMVQQFSQDPVSRDKGGLIGRLFWTKPDDPITTMAFHLKKGEVGAPVMNRMGYNILQVMEIRPNENRESYNTARPQIMSILQQSKRKKLNDAAREYQLKLQHKYAVSYDDSLISKTAAKIRSFGNTAGVICEGLKRQDAAFLNLPLAEYSFGTFPVRLLIDKIAAYGNNNRFSIPDAAALKSYVSRWMLPILLVHNAKDRGLDRNREMVDKYNQFARSYIIDKYREEIIIGSTDFSDSEIAEFYQKYKMTKYREPETRQVREIYVTDLDQAKELQARVKKGASMATLAERHTERRGYDRRKGMLGYIKQQGWGDIGQIAFTLNVGEISDPISTDSSPGYSIIKVLAVKPAHYLDPHSHRARILADMRDERITTKTRDWYTERKARMGTAINEEVLADVFTKQSQVQ